MYMLHVGVWGKWEGRVTCFLASEKQPSWQCVGGESPGAGRPALTLHQVSKFNRMWPRTKHSAF